MVLDGYENFISQILADLKRLKIDVSKLDMDHIGYQASSNEDYDRLVSEFKKVGEFVSEKIVGGRRVGIFKLNNPLKHKHYVSKAIELIAPKEGQVCPSALEHVEFVIKETFEEFMAKYPDLPWDRSKVYQPEFPMITLKLSGHTQVKFHYTPVLEIVS